MKAKVVDTGAKSVPDNRENLRFRKYSQLIAKLADILGKRRDLVLDMNKLPSNMVFYDNKQKIFYTDRGCGLPFSFDIIRDGVKACRVIGHIKGHATDYYEFNSSDLINFHVKIEEVLPYDRSLPCIRYDATCYFGQKRHKKTTESEVIYNREISDEIHAEVQKLGNYVMELVFTQNPVHDVDETKSVDLRYKVTAPVINPAATPEVKPKYPGFFECKPNSNNELSSESTLDYN